MTEVGVLMANAHIQRRMLPVRQWCQRPPDVIQLLVIPH